VTLRSSVRLGNFTGDPEAIPTGLYELVCQGAVSALMNNEP
jgi:hypothetical protein